MFVIRPRRAVAAMMPIVGISMMLLVTPQHSLRAEDGGRLMVMEENDLLASNTDRHYTQGAQLTYLTPALSSDGIWQAPYRFLGGFLPIFSGDSLTRKMEIHMGQNLFTPRDQTRINPSRKDRPYGAWLYTGVSWLQETNHQTHDTLENLELLGGVVGPLALGGITQNTFHQFIGADPSSGWKNGLHNEVGVLLAYERKWRFPVQLMGSFGMDAIPEIGMTAGNILTYGSAGGMVRIGRNLAADYGPARIRPSLSGSSWFNVRQLKGEKFGWYLYGGTQGRAIARNIFLDGNSWRDSPSIDKHHLVADFTGGLVLFWGDAIKADFSVTQRTKEYIGQPNMDRFGGINVSIGF